MPWLVIHRPTKVVRRIGYGGSISVAPDETPVFVAAAPALSDWSKVNGGGTVVAATAEEVTASGEKPGTTFQAATLRRLVRAARELADDDATDPTLREFAAALIAAWR